MNTGRLVPKKAWAACVCLLLAAAPACALDLAVPYVQADFLWTQGYSGTGLEIGVVDLFGADGTHPALTGNHCGNVNFVKSSAWISEHATAVAGCAASQDATYKGVAYGAGWWSGQTTNRGTITSLETQTAAVETFARGLGSLDGNPVEVITLSIGMSGSSNATDHWSLGLDHIVHADGRTITVAAGNDGPALGTLTGLPPGAYNVITVGATGDTGGDDSEDYSNVATYSSRGPTTDGRCKPDILAPGSLVHMPALGGGWADGSGTSFATPIVAGGAALLIDMGQHLGHSTDPKVVKSVLLNSADKLAGWTHTPTQPLDYQQGAGQMNLRTAHRQYLFDPRGPEAVPGIGWDLRQLSYNDRSLYTLDVDLSAGVVIAATLTWDRIVTATDEPDPKDISYDFDHLDDLNLYLYSADDLETPMASSVSTIDNVEHVYYSVAAAGRYVLGVEMAGAAPGDAETYALAWRAFPAAGLDLPGDANLDGVVDGLDYNVWSLHYEQQELVWTQGDWDGDGVADGLDYNLWSINYNPGGGQGAAVPEPVVLLPLTFGAAALLRRRNRVRLVSFA